MNDRSFISVRYAFQFCHTKISKSRTRKSHFWIPSTNKLDDVTRCSHFKLGRVCSFCTPTASSVTMRVRADGTTDVGVLRRSHLRYDRRRRRRHPHRDLLRMLFEKTGRKHNNACEHHPNNVPTRAAIDSRSVDQSINHPNRLFCKSQKH